MHLMLLGAPGSGKGTQAVRLAQYFRLAHLSTGDMLRATCREGGELGLVVDEYLKEGQLVPDHLVVQLVLDSLECNGTASGFIMDGFPRTLRQAKGCDVILTQRALALDAVILIDVANEILLKRSTGRRVDPETGRVYHLQFAPPPDSIVPRLEQRSDDSEPVVRERLDIYDREISPIVDHYQHQDLLTRVDGSGSPDQVFALILDRLGKN